MPPTLSEIEYLARQAGKILCAGFGQCHQISHKGIIDLVTEVDHRSEAYLLSEIQRRFPDDGIVTEERGDISGRECCLWYIDPLDGTVNYAHGVPIFTVSIAYAQDSLVRMGVVYDPMQEECYTAELGSGAWLNGQPIRVSDVRELDQSLLVTGFPYDIRTHPENNLDHYAYFSLHSQGVRRLGSAALDLGYVAAGRLDGFWELRIEPWDIAAGALIAQEAGATVTDLYGRPDYLSLPCSILATSPAIHPQMLEVFRRA